MARVIDLFAGTGAFSYVAEQNDMRVVFANDSCDKSKAIYDANFTHQLTLRDISKVDEKEIPDHDMLTAGFPCQPFSLAGERKGFDDDRSNVFWDIMRIIDYHQTPILFLENVKNIVTHDRGKTMMKIRTNLFKRGYFLSSIVVDTSKVTNIPHHRERFFMVAFKDESIFDRFEFKFDDTKISHIVDFLEQKIDEKYHYNERYKIWDVINNGVVRDISTDTVYQYRRTSVRENKSGLVPTLTANMGAGGHNVPLIRVNNIIRKFTPREVFNLQGFPPSYVLPQLSDSHLYKLAGNAVTVPVVDQIMKSIRLAVG